MSGRIDFTMGFNTQTAPKRIAGPIQYRVYVLGDFSAGTGLPWTERPIHKISLDTFDQILARLKPCLEIDSLTTLRFENLEAFHPDSWIGSLQRLSSLNGLKTELSHPATAAQAMAKIQALIPKAQEQQALQPPTETTDDLMERLLGKKPETPSVTENSLDILLQQMVSPHITHTPEPQQTALIDVIDSVINHMLQTIVHQADFQNLEALWRATSLLLNDECAEDHLFYLVDIGQAALLDQFKSDSHALEQKLLNHIQTGDGEQQILILGNYSFSDSVADKELFAFCAQLARKCHAYFIAGADPKMIQASAASGDGSQGWSSFLQPEELSHSMLAYPRFLLRLPYGKKRDPIESFKFEECSAIPQSSELLWGNPGFMVVTALIRMAQDHETGDACFFDDIPAFTFEQDGETILQPATETVLSEPQANRLLGCGIMPLISYRQRRGIRLLALTNLSENG